MSEKSKQQSEGEPKGSSASGSGASGEGATATAKPKKATKKVPKKRPPGFLPQWKVLLHNDDKNSVDFVIVTIVELTPLNKQEAELRTKEADKTGVALLLTTHKEKAELYEEQFQSKGLTVTIEPAEEG